MVDLKIKPFYLDDNAIQWVNDTIASMTLEEKIGQLFFFMGASRDEDYLRSILDNYHVGGSRYTPTAGAKQIYEQNRILQTYSKIPLLVATNTEDGGDGACMDGTAIGFPVKIAATGDVQYAYEMGRIGNLEAAAVGCNLSFAPAVDIHQNWQNPSVPNRCYSNNPEVVKNMGLAYFKGAHEAKPFACTAKHFPGEGMDFRDQHLCNSINSATCEEWDKSYGMVYSALIEAGLEAVMAGHVMQPAYTRYFNPQIKDEDIMPATLSKELLWGLLRGKLGFNGLIITDASHMLGMTTRMKRKDLVPQSIAAGCDMFLFFNDPDEDFDFMLNGYRNGVITEERLQDALQRILGLKAKLGLHHTSRDQILPPVENLHQVIGREEFHTIAAEVADKSITLVKNKQDGLFPLTPQKYPRITISMVHALDEYYAQALQQISLEQANVPEGFKPRGALSAGLTRAPEYLLKELLEQRGFSVDILENIAKVRYLAMKTNSDSKIDGAMAYAEKSSVDSFVSQRDLVILLSDVGFGVQPVSRPAWPFPKGSVSVPWYVHELPVIAVSLGNPFLLADIPQVRTYINAYDTESVTVEALAKKLCGEEPFIGQDPVDAFCGLWDTRL